MTRTPIIKTSIRHVVDRDGVVHRIVFNERTQQAAMVAARCNRVVVRSRSGAVYTALKPTCIDCLADSWEPA